MPDTDEDFDKAFDGFGETPPAVTPVADDKKEEPAKEEPKPADDDKKPEEPAKKDSEEAPDAPADDKKEEEPAKPAETPEAPAAPETPAPLTKSDVESVVSNLLNTERNSSKELETTAQEVLEAYYPEGLTNDLIDEKSGKVLKTPADVVEASGGEMSTDQATQWLMNEQYKLDQQVAKIKNDAKAIAETNVSFRRDSIAAVQKYEPLFKAYPHLQAKVFEKLKKQIKVDEKRGIVLSSPDVMEHYDDYLEPYQQAFEYATHKPATNPTAPPEGEPAKPSAEDRMDVDGDGGTTTPNDPNDFAQQVSKELAKGI